MSESSKFWVSREGQNYGPYSLEELKTYVAQGHFSELDSACEARKGAKWKSVGDFTRNRKRTARLDDPYKGSSSSKKSTSNDDDRDFYKGGSSGKSESNARALGKDDGFMAKAPPPDQKVTERIEKELSGDGLIIDLMESCVAKAEGDENKARSIYEKVRYKQLSKEKKDLENKAGIGCLFLFLAFLFIAFCGDDSENGGSKAENSYSYKQGYGDGYIVGKADKRDGKIKTSEQRERLASLHKNGYDSPFLYESGWKIGWIDGFQGNPKEH
jgi:hypothetical protein